MYALLAIAAIGFLGSLLLLRGFAESNESAALALDKYRQLLERARREAAATHGESPTAGDD